MNTENVSHLTFAQGLSIGHQFHIVISIAAFGILGLAVLQATLLYLQNYLLRSKRTSLLSSWLPWLPPLETMESHLFKIILFGFILLTFSLLSAWTFVDELYTTQRLHKIILSSLAWGVFAILLIGRYRAGWRGPTAIRWTLAGVVFLIIAYVSSKLILLGMEK